MSNLVRKSEIMKMFHWPSLWTIALLSLILPPQARGAGTWTDLTHQNPASYAPGAGHAVLLTDGTVMSHDDSGYWTNWYRLTPDSSGSYANGTWAVVPMRFNRYAFASQVLRDGRLFVAGGEHGDGGTNAEVFDPVSNVWTTIPVPPGLLNTIPMGGEGIGDAESVLLANGDVLIYPVYPAVCGGTLLFHPASNTFTQGPTLFRIRNCNEDEAGCVKLPDDSILMVDSESTNSSRYIPASNSFIDDASLPVNLWDDKMFEIGPAFLLPNGKAIFFGANGHTAMTE